MLWLLSSVSIWEVCTVLDMLPSGYMTFIACNISKILIPLNKSKSTPTRSLGWVLFHRLAQLFLLSNFGSIP